jgi:hydroxymethylpyrimidine pyrophosphatase-like HAD family hydrolase
MPNFIFDVDCVLTSPRTPIDPEFEKFFRQWMQGKNVYILSGSPYADIKSQLGDIVDKVNGFFPCQGNVLYVGGKLVYDMVWHCEELVDVLQVFIDTSKYPQQRGGLIDIRSGMINFSTLGRASKEERTEYNKWDAVEGERQKIVDFVNDHFSEICATIGGQVSIDIAPHGCDKSQIRNKIKGPIYFFGDQVQEGGNDWLLVRVLGKEDKVFPVNGWQDTWEILKNGYIGH